MYVNKRVTSFLHWPTDKIFPRWPLGPANISYNELILKDFAFCFFCCFFSADNWLASISLLYDTRASPSIKRQPSRPHIQYISGDIDTVELCIDLLWYWYDGGLMLHICPYANELFPCHFFIHIITVSVCWAQNLYNWLLVRAVDKIVVFI